MDIKDIMSFEEFQYKFIQGINEGGIETDIFHALQINREVTAVVNKNGNQLRPTIYIEDSYRDYMYGKAMDDIINDASAILKNTNDYAPELPTINDTIQKDKLYCSIINKENNIELLKKIPHQDLKDLDLTLVTRYKVGNNASVLVDNRMCASMKLTSEELLNIAKENTFNSEYAFKTLYDTIIDLGVFSRDELFENINMDYSFADNQVFVLTNKAGFHGASLLASKQVLNEIHDKLDSNYYILPSSIHEVIILPEKYVDKGTLDYMKFMVSDINEYVVDTKDILSDNVYYYDAKTCKLSIADGKERCHSEATDKIKTSTRGR